MKDKKRIILTCILLLFVLFFISIFFSVINMGNNNIFSKISIGNVSVSKKSKDEAISLLEDLSNKKKSSEIILEYTNNDEKYEKNLDLSIFNINYKIDNSVNRAYALGRKSNIFINNFVIMKMLLFRKNLDISCTYDKKMLDNIITDISANLPGKLVQSSYYVDNNSLIVTKGTPGVVVDKDAFTEKFKDFICNLNSSDGKISIPVKNVEPENIDLDKIHSEIYKEAKDAYFEIKPFKVFAEVKGVDFDLEKAKKYFSEHPDKDEYTFDLKITEPKTKLSNLNINVFPDLLATFSTSYDTSNKDRTTNLNIAASKIDQTIISPGEEFSYNKVVGERSIAAGYKEAKIYSGGKIIDGLGGGVCQISSTLYNAVMFANLKVTERFNHQFVTSYVPAGRDATVAYGSKDFKFINNRKYPIQININIANGIAKIDIYGIKEDPVYDVSIDVETISSIPFDTKYETDNTMPSGTEKIKQRGVNGVIVNSYKVIKQSGIIISKELISKDKYNALDKVIVKGTKNMETVETLSDAENAESNE